MSAIDDTIPSYRASLVRWSPQEWHDAGRSSPVGTHDWTELPSVMANWEREKLANAGLDISQVSKGLTSVAWLWQCVNGHRWREPTSGIAAGSRLGSSPAPRWKRVGGSWSSCRACVLDMFGQRYEDCGHRAGSLASISNPPLVMPGLCSDCRLGTDTGRAMEAKRGESTDPPEQLTSMRREPDTLEVSACVAALGDLVPPRSSETSKLEAQVRAFVIAAGYSALQEPAGILCRHPDQGKRNLTLTPDIIFPALRLAVEVDPCMPSPYGLTHHGDEEKDLLRNRLLEDVGWTILRLRLGSCEGGHIGTRDVVVESDGLTQAAKAALIEAIEDFIHHRPATVRLVKKGAARKTPRRRSTVANIRARNYSEDGHIFTWYPSLDSSEKHYLRLCFDGRYLYTHQGPEPKFIADVGLNTVPMRDWKDRLSAVLENHSQDVAGTTKWPWGESLLIASGPEIPEVHELLYECERQGSIDLPQFSFTVSGHAVTAHDGTRLVAHEGRAVAQLHFDAVSVGYQFVSVENAKGMHGPYQRMTVSRSPKGH